MSISYSLRLSQSEIFGRQRSQKLTKGVSYSGRPFPYLHNPPPFCPFLPIPYPLRRLLHSTAFFTGPYVHAFWVVHFDLVAICAIYLLFGRLLLVSLIS